MRSKGTCRESAVFVLAMSLSLAGQVRAQEPSSQWEALVQFDEAPRELIPLTRIGVRGQITGTLAVVEVEQHFENHLGEPTEAIYVFPLPDDAAVHEMVMVIGERRIVADLQERREARATYEQARSQGRVASLLEQERPNIFTMSVANIQPGQPISVLIRYVEELEYLDGRYRFHFPTTVGPRFIPGTPWGSVGDGVLPDTDIIPDASRITPAVLPEGTQTPYEVDLQLEIEAPMPLIDLRSVTHDLALTPRSERQVLVTLPNGQRHPDRDIDLSYALAGQQPAMGMMTHHDPERGGFFTLLLQPPLSFDQRQVRPRELVFVLDTSGSMFGYPMEASKEVMRHALRNLNPGDTFQIIRFSDAASTLSPIPLASTSANVRRGQRFIDELAVGGGTNMTEGIRAALEPSQDPGRLRIVLFLTDGYIGNEEDVLALIDQHLDQGRLFSLGVGSSVNRALLNRMASRGRGAVQYVTTEEPIRPVVQAFYSRFRSPVFTDISVDWGELDVTDVVPARIPDLFVGTPIMVSGRFTQGGSGTVVVRGQHGRAQVEIPLHVNLVANGHRRPAVPCLWARRHVEQLERQHGHDSERLRATVLPLALRYGLLTRFTSFVATEQRIDAETNDPLRTLTVPVAMPARVSQTQLGPQVLPAVRRRPAGTGRVASAGRSVSGPRNQAFAGRSASVPMIRTGAATVQGSLSKTAVRRTIDLQRNRIRGCYERALLLQPDLLGRVTVRFVIAPSGAVSSAQIAHSTLNDPGLEQCIVETIYDLSFAAVDGSGVVVVTYPFQFQIREPGDHDSP